MSKRMTKSERETVARAAFEQRIEDICCGAGGRDLRVGSMDEFMQPDDLARIIPALCVFWPALEEDNKWLIRPCNLDKFSDVATLVAFLFGNGLRADGKEKA